MTGFGLNTYEHKAMYWAVVKTTDKHALQLAIKEMPAITAEVLRLHHQNNKSMKEISLALGKSISTVRNHYNKGIFLLHKKLENVNPS